MPVTPVTGVAQQPPSSSTVNLGNKMFNIGSIVAGGTATITPIIYPSISASGTVQTLNLGISYSDANGNKKTSNQLIGLQTIPSSPQSGLSVTPSSLSFSSSSTSSATITSPQSNTDKNPSNINTGISPKSLSPLQSTNDSSSLIQVTAGKIQDLKFTINNNNAAYF